MYERETGKGSRQHTKIPQSLPINVRHRHSYLAFSQPSRQLATSYIKTINDLYIKTKSNARKSHKNKNHTHRGPRDNGKDRRAEVRKIGKMEGKTTTAGDVKREFCEFY